ncbi:NAD(P)-binding domain containing protein, partial [Parasponia andersonii]
WFSHGTISSKFCIHSVCHSYFQAELVDPAVKGTLNVQRSCAKVPTEKRVVLISSMAAATYNGKPLTADVVLDETWFSDSAYCEKLRACMFVLFALLISFIYLILQHSSRCTTTPFF